MKISNKSLEFANHNQGSKPPPIPFYMVDDAKKLSLSDYQTYKLRTNPKDEKSLVYNLGQDIQDKDAAYSLVKSLLRGYALQIFKNKEASQDIKDSPNFTKCLAAVTEHVFSEKTYKTQKKYLWNICKPLRLGSQEWILHMIKLNNYLEYFPVPDGVTAEKINQEEFVD
eukprot:10488780-Ditylum_brightwellii.AAC.1